MNDFFNTFGDAVDAIFTRAFSQKAFFDCIDDVYSICSEPLNYGQTRSQSFKLRELKGKPTKKYFHASIYRMDSGRYELTTYVL